MNMKIIAQIFVIILFLTSAIPLVCAQEQLKADLKVTSNVASDVATFGAAEDATEGFDTGYDEPQIGPPPSPPYLRAYFYYPNSTYTPPDPPSGNLTTADLIITELTTSYIALGGILEWPLKIDYANTTTGFTNITIAWNLSEVPEEYLVSLHTDEGAINMRERLSYTINTSKSSGSYEFNITAAKDLISPIITNVTAMEITNNSAIITWDTDESSNSLVKYDIESENYTLTAYNATNITSHRIELTGLSQNTTYYYVVNSTDQNGNSNESVEHNFITKAPSPCFIATAAYGTPMHEDINVLRDFRDRYLMTNPVGRTFVKVYYKTSPPIADVISENEGLRTIVRDGLVKPLVYISRLFV
ncbi:MAG: hypothetical protein GIS02_02040 [Methanosarcinales archaeon]|uniref:Fibronectin type-III domain-containing protein n=1 Tax=Candidatus Ethanoperedens thermophilum TaxID=2766897 RepID=A0A848D7Z9_9EURY|nr:hypothetical protein [Candidatus Ethanoperedens thermophilum]